MSITKEQMERIQSYLDGDPREMMGAWILDKNALNLALERVPKEDEIVIKKADYERLIKSLPATPRIVR